MSPGRRPVLAIAGAGDLDGELRAHASNAGVADRVVFLGNLAQDEVGRWFAAADVIAAPSVRDDSGNVDGLPNTVLEALASATPLVTTAAGGIGSVVTDGRSGLIVPERDPAGLARAMDRLLDDRSAAARIGAAGRALVEERFGWTRVAERLSDAYDRALAFTLRGR
jgi:glycosyltransferase involved in cell wall biosynthesis